jgi:hypothetical protein
MGCKGEAGMNKRHSAWFRYGNFKKKDLIPALSAENARYTLNAES